MAWDLYDRPGKLQAVIFAGDEAGTEAPLHVDLNTGKRSAPVGANGVAAFSDWFGAEDHPAKQRQARNDTRNECDDGSAAVYLHIPL
ncbi:hypothetical protein [Bradyrhizobium sp. BEA-2-5]|uniref:hypothetical protein n=1 Tax=Bradyrhizobium sp. BEA-2-5 TaxID=3080015 RepID=UPI00397D3BD9